MIGVPFPSLSTETQLIKAHNDSIFGRGAGDDWYEAEAYRQVNQAAGRLIRHQNDFGFLALMDARYDTAKAKGPNSALSSWVRDGLKVKANNKNVYIYIYLSFCNKEILKLNFN